MSNYGPGITDADYDRWALDNHEPREGYEAVRDLTYVSYRHNREIAPDVSAERWEKIYADAKAMEARYQAEHAEISTDSHE